MSDWREVMLDHVVLGNSILRWLVALAIATGAFLVLAAIKRWDGGRLVRYTKGTSRQWDDGIAEVVRATKYLFLFAFAAYLGTAETGRGPAPALPRQPRAV